MRRAVEACNQAVDTIPLEAELRLADLVELEKSKSQVESDLEESIVMAEVLFNDCHAIHWFPTIKPHLLAVRKGKSKLRQAFTSAWARVEKLLAHYRSTIDKANFGARIPRQLTECSPIATSYLRNLELHTKYKDMAMLDDNVTWWVAEAKLTRSTACSSQVTMNLTAESPSRKVGQLFCLPVSPVVLTKRPLPQPHVQALTFSTGVTRLVAFPFVLPERGVTLRLSAPDGTACGTSSLDFEDKSLKFFFGTAWCNDVSISSRLSFWRMHCRTQS